MPFVVFEHVIGRIRAHKGLYAAECGLTIVSMGGPGLHCICPHCEADKAKPRGLILIGDYGAGCAVDACPMGGGNFFEFYRYCTNGGGSDREAAIELCEALGWSDLLTTNYRRR